jgi:S1-C subfamily serine protease
MPGRKVRMRGLCWTLSVMSLAVLCLIGPGVALGQRHTQIQQDDRVADVVEMASRTIVNIKTEELLKTESEDKKSSPSLFRKYFSGEDEVEELVENIGSGVVLDPKGIVVTNEHLIARAINIRVKFMNGKEYEPTCSAAIGYDIALLKIVPTGWISPISRSGRGRSVLVRGRCSRNPYGPPVPFLGVVSALGRNLRIDNKVYANLIQTDAAINPVNARWCPSGSTVSPRHRHGDLR